MAHQVRQGISIKSGPRHVLQRPALAALLGNMVAEWGLMENRLIHFYAYLMGRYLPRPDPGFAAPIHPVALQVFEEVDTVHKRLVLIERLFKWVVKDQALAGELADVIRTVREASGRRNDYVHGHWGIADEYPDALILSPVFGRTMAYKEADFNEVIDLIVSARSTLGVFEAKTRQALDKAA